MQISEILAADFIPFPELIHRQAVRRPDAEALVDGDQRLTWAELNREVDRIAAALQRAGMAKGDPVALAGRNSASYALVFIAALRAGGVATPLTGSSTAEGLANMLADCGARLLFVDAGIGARLAQTKLSGVTRIALEPGAPGIPLEQWIGPGDAKPAPVEIAPDDPFNIIYSSGTTGTPKGIVQSHEMRWQHIRRQLPQGYGDDTVTINSTPLYSNTTLVSFVPTLAAGAKVVLMPKFDAREFLIIAERERATHAMLVPVQYQRIMALEDFDAFDLSSFRMKSCTSAPFRPALKADVLARWPGGLTEIYGMTEGGATCLLAAHEHPGKLHTVGRPAAGHDVRLIDEAGNEVPPGERGEVVGRSPVMMTSYYHQPEKTREAEWYDSEGRRYIRHGDIARFDEDGFLILLDRSKDMIISGGFNVYPVELERALLEYDAVLDAAVIGVPSEQWGETPVGFVVLADGADKEQILARTNARLGKTQRISRLETVMALPRNQIGKVLKRELRERIVPNP